MSEIVSSPTSVRGRRVRIWDLPVRLFHWTLVLLLGSLYVTAEVMDDGIETHALAGYMLLTLVLFRIVWGFVGSTYARFGSFLRGPAAAWRYLRRPAFVAGHNPLGGWMIVALLAGLLLQAVLGLFSNDDILFDGPLRHLVDKETSDWLTALHHELFTVLLVLVVLHVAAVAAHKIFKGEDLVAAMFTGYKALPAGETAEEVRGGSLLLAALLLALCGGGVYLIVA